jgi:hypothetical protein
MVSAQTRADCGMFIRKFLYYCVWLEVSRMQVSSVAFSEAAFLEQVRTVERRRIFTCVLWLREEGGEILYFEAIRRAKRFKANVHILYYMRLMQTYMCHMHIPLFAGLLGPWMTPSCLAWLWQVSIVSFYRRLLVSRHSLLINASLDHIHPYFGKSC